MPSDLNILGAASLVLVTDHGRPRSGSAQGELDIVNDGALAIRDGRIAAFGPTKEVLETAGEASVTIDARGKTVLPGLVECHSHPLFAGRRDGEYPRKIRGATSTEIARDGGGIWSTVLATRDASDDELLANAVKAYERILAGGVTTLEVKTGYGQTTEHELRLLELLNASKELTPLDLVCTFLGAHVLDPHDSSPETYVRGVVEEMLPRVAEQGIAEFHDLVCEADVFEASLSGELLAASARLGLPARVHADASGPSDGWRTAVSGGAVAADHLTYTPDSEICSVGATDTIAVLLPIAEQLYLDDRRANARRFIEEGVPVAIATDYCSSIHASSLTLAIGLSTCWYRITPAEAIVGGTINAAYVLGRNKDRGSLDLGKRGDVVVMDCASPDELAVAVGSPLVDVVISEGRVIWQKHPSGHE